MDPWIQRGLKGCGLGCGALLLLMAILLAGMWIVTSRVSNEAVDTREALERSFASQSAFTPSLDQPVAADRLGRFLAVRSVLAARCDELSRYRHSMRQVEERVEELNEREKEPEAKELVSVLSGGRSALWSVIRLGHDVGKFEVLRNKTLAVHEMGLGEYTWIYVIAYYSWLGHRPVDFIEADGHARIFFDRVLGDVRGMMQRFVQQLEDAVRGGSALEMSSEMRRRQTLWRDELDAMAVDPHRIPFQDGLPPELEAQLEPFRTDLERLFCAATGEIDIMRTEKSGLRYEHR